MIIVGLMVFAVFFIGILLVVHQYKPIIRSWKAQRKAHNEEENNRFISILSSNVSERKKAEAFVSLMMNSYVLVHTLINHGNKYNDAKQKELFCASMTTKRIENINSLEENNG